LKLPSIEWLSTRSQIYQIYTKTKSSSFSILLLNNSRIHDLFSFTYKIERVPICLPCSLSGKLSPVQDMTDPCILCFMSYQKCVCKYLKIARCSLLSELFLSKAGAKIGTISQIPKLISKFFSFFSPFRKPNWESVCLALFVVATTFPHCFLLKRKGYKDSKDYRYLPNIFTIF
jgi:hypothetical protein